LRERVLEDEIRCKKLKSAKEQLPRSHNDIAGNWLCLPQLITKCSTDKPADRKRQPDPRAKSQQRQDTRDHKGRQSQRIPYAFQSLDEGGWYRHPTGLAGYQGEPVGEQLEMPKQYPPGSHPSLVDLAEVAAYGQEG